MNLRTRILLGYGYLIVLLVVSAVGAALGFHQLGTEIGRLLAENFASVRASMSMLEALERQDSALLAVLLGETESRELLDDSEASFSEALQLASGNVTVEGERELLDDIGQRFSEYRLAREQLLASRPERPLRAYEADAFPRFEAVKTLVFRLLDLNHQAMIEADRRAQRAAARRGLGAGLLVTIALVSLGFLSRTMGRHIFSRLEALRDVAGAIADGDYSRRAAADRRDELGVIANQMNAMLDAQQELRSEMEGRVARLKQSVLGLLGSRDEPAAFVSMSGEVLATVLSEEDTASVAETAATLLRSRDDSTEAETLTLDAGRGPVSFRLVEAGTRPVGWLATLRH